jgi:hypothetical protein
MGKKITWTESFTTTLFYSAEITDNEAELFEIDPDRFFDEVGFRDNQELVNDKIDDIGAENFEIEED